MLSELLYAADSDDGKIPAFESRHLPGWWGLYTGGRQLDPGKIYVLDPKIVGQKASDLSPQESWVLEKRF